MGDIAIRVDGLGKQYRIGATQAKYKTFRETLTEMATAPIRRAGNLLRGQAYGAAELNETIWALRDVSFEVKHGDVVGIIGRNGAGKSTLLKILSRITEPSEGQVDLYGRVGALLEVGTGFHPELTGRENVYLNASILGMSRTEIERKFDEIVDFAGVDQFIDTPVKHYSSGMALRLGFAVAAHLEPEILVVDEVLAVGDAAFQKKCLGKMSDVANEGRTVLFVSHNMAAVQGLCKYGVLIERGNMVMMDEVSKTIQRYITDAMDAYQPENLSERKDRKGNGAVRFTQLTFGHGKEADAGFWVSGERALVKMDYRVPPGQKANHVEVAFGIRSLEQTPLIYMGSKVVRYEIPQLSGEGSFICEIPRLPLEASSYSITIEIKVNGIIADYIANASWIDVAEGDFYGTGVIWPYGKFLTDYTWAHQDTEPTHEPLADLSTDGN